MVDLNQAYQEAKTLPDEALARELESPSGMLPGYIVMAEMEDRKAIRSGGGGKPAPKMSMKDELLQGIQSVQNFAGGGLVSNLNPIYQQLQAMRNPMMGVMAQQQQMNEANGGYQPLISPMALQPPGELQGLESLVPGPSGAPEPPRGLGRLMRG